MTKVVWQQNFFNTFLTNSWWNCIVSFLQWHSTTSCPNRMEKTLFTMLPKKSRAKLVTDFRPIANGRLFYKVFALMIPARAEQSLESFSPDAHHTFFFFFPPLLFSRRWSIDTGLLYWAASRHRLFLYWPVSRCACGREGVSPDLPLPCWEATDRHGWARV